jgi:RNA recognition motif-containing protein
MLKKKEVNEKFLEKKLEKKQRRKQRLESKRDESTLDVSNLDENVTEQDLKNFFGKNCVSVYFIQQRKDKTKHIGKVIQFFLIFRLLFILTQNKMLRKL